MVTLPASLGPFHCWRSKTKEDFDKGPAGYRKDERGIDLNPSPLVSEAVMEAHSLDIEEMPPTDTWYILTPDCEWTTI